MAKHSKGLPTLILDPQLERGPKRVTIATSAPYNFSLGMSYMQRTNSLVQSLHNDKLKLLTIKTTTLQCLDFKKKTNKKLDQD